MSGKSNSSTGNMKKHMERKHPEILSIESIEQEEAFVSFHKILVSRVASNDISFRFSHRINFARLS